MKIHFSEIQRFQKTTRISQKFYRIIAIKLEISLVQNELIGTVVYGKWQISLTVTYS